MPEHDLPTRLKDLADPPRDGFFDELDARLAKEPIPVRDAPSRRRVTLLAAPMTAAAAVLVILAVVLPRSEPSDAPGDLALPTTTLPAPSTTVLAPVLASDVILKAQNAYSTATSLQADYDSFRSRDAYEVNGRPVHGAQINKGKIRLLANGSYWYTRNSADPFIPDDNEQVSYNAPAGTARICFTQGTPQLVCQDNRGIVSNPASGQLYGEAARSFLGLSRMGLVLRAVSPTNDALPTDVTYEGRSAWQISAPISDDYRLGARTAVITIDKESAFPLAVSIQNKGREVDHFKFHNVVLNAEIPPAQLTVTVPKGTPVTASDRTIYAQRTTLAQVQSARGYRVQQPTLPEGFGLVEVSIAAKLPVDLFEYVDPKAQALFRAPDGSDRTYLDTNAVFLTYRRGLESFTVSIRTPASGFPVARINPFDSEQYEDPVASSDVSLTSGLYAGQKAHLTVYDDTTTAWLVNKTALVTIGGDITSATATDLLNSLS